ncbi:hypothetical protein, partial [Clostridium perfringens]
LSCWRRASGDRHDGDGGADGESGEGDGDDHRDGGALGGFEAEKHGVIPFGIRCRSIRQRY